MLDPEPYPDPYKINADPLCLKVIFLFLVYQILVLLWIQFSYQLARDMDPAFSLNVDTDADPDPGSPTNADPDWSDYKV